ncbi:mucin-2-like [Bacillus rossius redtenbacheri]|uniref:mucin-2-like n=1 Tax=Bacillus rossius redtenbacheri TaxID=93214 RepID=UPI002FDE15C5
MTAFNEHQFEKKLQYLKDSQESIQSLSSWCLQHRQHHKKIVSSWLRVMKKVKVEHRLTLFYLANDVIQYSKRKSYEFVESWGTALQRATPMVREEKVKHKILRIFKIWNDRGVYDDSFVSDLCGLLSTQTKKTQPEPALVETEFQSSALFDLIRSCSQLDDETDTRLRKLKESPISVCDADGICTILKDRRQGDDLVVEVDEGIGKMQAYVTALQHETKRREQLIEQLEQAQIYYSSQYGEAKIVCNAYRNFGNRVKQLKRKLDELIPSLKDASPLPSPDVNAPSPSPDSDIDLPDERSTLRGALDEEGFTPEGRPLGTTVMDDSHSLDNCFTSFLGNAASLPFDLQKNLFGESSPRLALTPSPIHNLLEESGELPLLSLSCTSEGKPIEVISSRSKPDEGFSISDFFKNLSTNIPGLDVDGAGDSQPSPVVTKEDSFSSLPGIIDSIASRYDYSSIVTTSSSIELPDVTSRYEYSAVITTPNTIPPLPPPPVSVVDSVSRYEYSPITTPPKQTYEYPPVVMTPSVPPPPPAADASLARYDEYTPTISTSTIQAAAVVPDVSVPRYDEYTPAMTTPTVPPLPAKSTGPRYDDYSPVITKTSIPPPLVKSSVQLYEEYTPAITTTNVAPPPVKQYEGYSPTVTSASTMQPPPPIPEMMESAVSRYEYPPAVTTPTPLQPPPLPPNLFPLEKYGHEEEAAASWSSKLPPKFPTWGDTPAESEWTPAMPAMPLDLDTPESPPMYEKEGFSDPVEYDEAGDVDHRTLVTLQLSDVDHRSLPLAGKKDVDHRPAGVRKKDVDHRNLISLTGSPLRDVPWARADQDYRTVSRPEADRDYRVPRPLGQELHDNVESVDMELSDEEPLEPASRRDSKPLVSFNISSPSKVLPSSPLREDDRPRAPFFPAQRIPTIGGSARNFRGRGAGAANNFTRPPPLPRGFRPAPLAPPPPPPPQFLNNTDKFRSPPPPLHSSPQAMKHASNFSGRSPVKNNFTTHTRNFLTQPTSTGPLTPTKNTALSYPNVKSLQQVKPVSAAGMKTPVSTASTPTQTERTLTEVKAQPMQSPQGVAKQTPQQQNMNKSSSTAVEMQRSQSETQNSKAPPVSQNPTTATTNTVTVPQLSAQSNPKAVSTSPVQNATKQPPQSLQLDNKPQVTAKPPPFGNKPLQTSTTPVQITTKPPPFVNKPPTTSSPVQDTTKPPTLVTKQTSTPTPVQNAMKSPSFGNKPPTVPTSPVQNTTKPPPFGNKPPMVSTSPVQNTTQPPPFGNKPPTVPTSPVQNTTKPPPFGNKPPTVSTSPVQNTTKPPPFGNRPPTVPTSPVQNTTKPPPFGNKPPTVSTSPVQNTTKPPPFGNKPPTVSTSPVQNTTKPPLFGNKPPTVSTSPVQNTTQPQPFGNKPPTVSTSPVQNTTQPPPFGNKPPTVPTSPVQNTTKPPPFGNKPPTVPTSPVQNTTKPPPFGNKPPTVPTSPVQNTTKPPPFGNKPPTVPTSPVQNTAKPPPFGNKPPTVPTSVQNITRPPLLGNTPHSVPTSPVQNTNRPPLLGNKPPAVPVPPVQSTPRPPLFGNKPAAVQSTSQPAPDSAGTDAAAQGPPPRSGEAGPSRGQGARPANCREARSVPPAYGGLKREHEDEPWMNDDIPEFESPDVEPRPKVQGLSRPPRARGRGQPYAPRARAPQWPGPPLLRFPYRPPPPPPPPPPLMGMRPPRGPFRPPFRARRGRW